jgi:hypothetical protein
MFVYLIFTYLVYIYMYICLFVVLVHNELDAAV